MKAGRSFEIGHDVLHHAAGELHARRNIGIDEVQRHLLVQLVGGIDALEIGVQDHRTVGMALHIAQQAHLLLAIEVDVQHGGVEGLLAQQLKQLVVVDVDLLRLVRATVQNAGYPAGATQAAARSSALSIALVCVEFELHDLLQ